jgi:hypothetical protein
MFTFLGCALAATLHAQDSLQSVKDDYEQALTKIGVEKAGAEVQAQMALAKYLDDTLQQIKNSGDLTNYLAAEEYANKMKAGEVATPSHPAMTKLTAAYNSQIKENEVRFRDQTDRINRQYIAKLDTLIASLMKADRIEEAKAVQAELELLKATTKMQAQKDVPARPAAPPTPNTFKSGKIGAAEWNGHHYKYFDERVTWDVAKMRCSQLGGRLVVLDAADENAFAAKLLPKKSGGWIGYHLLATHFTKPRWVSVSGKFAWRPKNDWRIQRFIRKSGDRWLFMHSNGKWYGKRPAEQPVRGYICEWEY